MFQLACTGLWYLKVNRKLQDALKILSQCWGWGGRSKNEVLLNLISRISKALGVKSKHFLAASESQHDLPHLSSLVRCLAVGTLPLHSAWSNTDTSGPLMCPVPTKSRNSLISATEALPRQSLHLANFHSTLTRIVITFFNAVTPASNKLPRTQEINNN